MFPEITLLGPSLLSVSPSTRKLRQIEVRPVLSGRPTIPSTVGEGARTPFLHPSVCQQPWAVSAGLSGAGTAARTAVQVCAAQTPETPSQALSCSARNNKSGVSGRAAPPPRPGERTGPWPAGIGDRCPAFSKSLGVQPLWTPSFSSERVWTTRQWLQEPYGQAAWRSGA